VRPPRFVGRESESAALVEALAHPPAIVLIEGEAGIGKSRLIQEYLATSKGTSGKVLVACCPPLATPQTLAAITDGLRETTQDLRNLNLSAAAGALQPLFPEWSAELPPSPEPAMDAFAARHRVFRAIAELLARLHIRVLVVEDAHWADEATLEFLLYLTASLPQEPLSMVVTYRPEDVPADSLLLRLSSRLVPGMSLTRLALGPLDVQETARLASSMLITEHVSAGFAELLHLRTEGVPLALEESIRLLAHRGEAFTCAGGRARHGLSELIVPPTIRDAVQERVQRLYPDARAVLAAAAVLAEPATEEVVQAVAGLAADAATAGLCEAVRCGLLTADGRGLVSFRHVLACRAVYEAVPTPERRALHLRAARVLEGSSPLPVAQLTRHFRDAGDTSKWCEYAERTADLAILAGDEATAAVVLHDLLVNGRLPPSSLVRLIRKLPFASFIGLSRYRELADALRSSLAAQSTKRGENAAVRLQLGRVLFAMEDFEAAYAELEDAIPYLEDAAEAGKAMALLGWPFGTSWPVSVHLRWLRCAARAEQVTPMAPADRLRLMVDRVTALLALGQEEAWAEAARLPDDARAPGERHGITCGHLNFGDLAMVWGRYARADRFLARALELTDRHQYLRYRDQILASQAHLHWLTGAWDGLAGHVVAMADDEETQPTARLEAALVAGLLRAAAGCHGQAEDRLRLVLDERRRRGQMPYAAEPAAALAALWLARGRVDDALTVTGELADVICRKGCWVWATGLAPARAAALAAGGRLGEAGELVAAFARGLRGRDAPAPRAALILCRAILVQGRGENARAATLFAHAAAAWQALPRPYDALLAREQQAGCLLAAGKNDAGLALLSEVFKRLSDLGARGDAVRVMGTLAGHGVEVRRPWWGGRRGYGDQLSPRELEVARLLAGGRTNREIAGKLFLSPKTVARHLDSAMRKLNVSSRTALAVKIAEGSPVQIGSPELQIGSPRR